MSFVNQMLMVAGEVDNNIFDNGNQVGDGDGEGIANPGGRIKSFSDRPAPIAEALES